jgi:phage major head subunit gpT-like protein
MALTTNVRQQYEFLTRPGVISMFFQAMEEIPDSWLTRVCQTVTSDSAYTVHSGLGNPPILRQWKGGRQLKRPSEYKLIIPNVLYEATMEFGMEDLRWDKTAQIQAKIGGLATRTQEQAMQYISYLIDTGNAGTYGYAFDDDTFFSASRTVGSSGTIKNTVTLNIANLPTGTSAHGVITNPSQAEVAMGVNLCIQQMRGWKDDQGFPANQMMKSVTVMVPVNLEAAFTSAWNMTTLWAGVTNPLNPTWAFGACAKQLVVNPFLTTGAVFYVFRDDAPNKPLIIQNEYGPMMDALTDGSEWAFFNHSHLYGTWLSRGFGFGIPWHALKCTMTGSGADDFGAT